MDFVCFELKFWSDIFLFASNWMKEIYWKMDTIWFIWILCFFIFALRLWQKKFNAVKDICKLLNSELLYVINKKKTEKEISSINSVCTLHFAERVEKRNFFEAKNGNHCVEKLIYLKSWRFFLLPLSTE